MELRGLALAAPLAALLTATAGCAPDAWRNDQAAGFNDYLRTVETRCQPLWFGQWNLESFDADMAGSHASDYSALLDNASRLYSGDMSPGQFRGSVHAIALTSTDARTNRTIDCMVAQLPATGAARPPGAR